MKNLTTTVFLDGIKAGTLIELEVNYDYDSGEEGTWRDSNGTGMPDISRSVTICSVFKAGDDIFDLLSQAAKDEIEEKLLGA